MAVQLNPIITQKLKRKFQFVEITDQKIILGNSRYNNGEIISEYECSAKGAFTKERGQLIQISDMGNIEQNAIGLLCSFYQTPNVTEEERKNLTAAETQTDIFKIFINILGEEHIRKNLFFNPPCFVCNAINVLIGEKSYEIYLVSGNKKLKLASFVNNTNNIVYRTILKELKTKNFFEQVIVEELSLHHFEAEDLLKLFAIYEYNMPVKLMDI